MALNLIELVNTRWRETVEPPPSHPPAFSMKITNPKPFWSEPQTRNDVNHSNNKRKEKCNLL